MEVNIAIMRTFVQLRRRLMDSNRDLAARIDAMEQKYDKQFATIFAAIHQLIAEDDAAKAKPRSRTGFHQDGRLDESAAPGSRPGRRRRFSIPLPAVPRVTWSDRSHR